MTQMTSAQIFTGDETISDIMLQLHEAADILTSHGLACVGCHINVYETLRQGMSMHGMKEDHLQLVLADLNEAALDSGMHSMDEGQRPLKVTSEAIVAIKEFQEEAGIYGWGITVHTTEDESFEIDFAQDPSQDQMDITIGGIRFYFLPETYSLLANHVLDYIQEEGFSVAHI
jgi:hybrid cluster-associated redox disulfide protein